MDDFDVQLYMYLSVGSIWIFAKWSVKSRTRASNKAIWHDLLCDENNIIL